MKNSKKTAKVMLVGALTLAMSVTTLFSGVGESYAASELKLNKTSRNILTRRSYDFDVVGASADAEITWKSSNEKVATVDKDGVVTGITKGEAKITCTIKDGGETVKLTATAKIRKPAVKIAIRNKIEKLEVGEEYDLNRKLTPSTSNDVTTWKSSNKKIATVDKNGVVTAKANGTVTITATTMSGKTDSVKIKVYGGKATATPKPEAPKATKAPEAPKATQAPKATATPKPQAPAKAETKTFTFAQMTQPQDKGGVWNGTVEVDGKGKLTMNCTSAYAQSFWQFPVDMKNVEKVTFNGVKGAGFEVRMMTADEYTAYDGSQTATFQSSDTSYTTNGTPLAYLNVTSTDGGAVSVESISFTMKAGGAAAEKPATSAIKLVAMQPDVVTVNGNKATMEPGYKTAFYTVPSGVDGSKVSSVDITFSSDQQICIKLKDAEGNGLMDDAYPNYGVTAMTELTVNYPVTNAGTLAQVEFMSLDNKVNIEVKSVKFNTK